MKKIPYSAYILKNTEYNTLQEKGYNMNKIKSILHNKVLLSLMKKDNYVTDMVVIDQFTSPRSYYSFLKNEDNVFRKITFTTKAEDKCLSVACSSIISRYIFLKECEELSNKLGSFVPKGAGVIVDEYGKKVVAKYGKDILKEVAKLNFKNTEKILNN